MKVVKFCSIIFMMSVLLFSFSSIVKADDLVPPTITQISSATPNGYYREGAIISVTVDFSEPVYTSGTTTLSLTSGILTSCDFSINSGAATSTIACLYTVGSSDETSSDYLDLRSMTANIYDIAGHAMVDFEPASLLSATSQISIDNYPPRISETVTTADNGYYDVGEVIPITVRFNELIYAVGDITVNLNASSTANCTFQIASSSPASTGFCNYIVQPGDSTTDLGVSSISGNVYDRSGNSLVVIPDTDFSTTHDLKISTNRPRISTITSPSSDGLYAVGDIITLDLLFSEAIYTVGNVSLDLNASSTADCVFQVASSSPSTIATCIYTVATDDLTDDLNITSGLGDIYSASDDDQLLNFNIRDENLTDHSNLQIDGVLPVITTVRFDTAVPDGSYNSGAGVFNIVFSEPITLASTTSLIFDVGTCNFSTAIGLTNTATCLYTIVSGYNSDRLNITGITGNIYDEAGNHQTILAPDDSYFGNRYIVIDTIAPTSTLANLPSDQTTNTGTSITVSGIGVDYYKYTIDGGAVSAQIATSTSMTLSGLAAGVHTLKVAGRDKAGNWQDIVANPTIHTWTITTPAVSGGGGGGGGSRISSPLIPAPQVLGVKIYAYASGRIIKTANESAVYHISDDGVRHLYPNAVTFWTWHTGSWADQSLEIIPQAEFDALIEGTHVTVKPDSKLIRFYNSPKVYVVSDGAVINHVSTTVALELYGVKWEKAVIKIQNGFENDYDRGEPITL